MKMLQRLGLSVLCCLLLPLAGQAAPPTKAPLVIAHVAATSGRFSLHAEADRRGADLAIEDFNARGGVLGREVVSQDSFGGMAPILLPMVIAGLGNLLLRDDGVGVHAIAALLEDPPQGVELMDARTRGQAGSATQAQAAAYWPGVTPHWCLKWREKWLWS